MKVRTENLTHEMMMVQPLDQDTVEILLVLLTNWNIYQIDYNNILIKSFTQMKRGLLIDYRGGIDLLKMLSILVI